MVSVAHLILLHGWSVDALAENLPGQFAVWCSSEEARFLHGRFVAAWWDVNELGGAEVRERMKSQYHFLRVGLVGV